MVNSRSSTAAVEASENDDGVSLLSDHGVDVARYHEAVAANERLLSSSQRHSTAVLVAAGAAEAAIAEAAAAKAAARSLGSRADLSKSWHTRNIVPATQAQAQVLPRVIDQTPWKAALADLHPVGARIEHIGLDMHRSAGDLVAEVRQLSDRLALAATPIHRQPDSWGEHTGACQNQGKMLGRPNQSLTSVVPGHRQLESSGGELSEGWLGQTHELYRPAQTVTSTDSPAHRDHARATSSSSLLPSAPSPDELPNSAWQKESEAVLREFKAWEAERSMLLSQISQLKQALEERECQVSQLMKSLEQRELQQECQASQLKMLEQRGSQQECQVSHLKKTLHQQEIQQESQVSQLKKELEQRDFELASRPTHRLTQLMRNKIAELERRASAEPCQFDKRRLADTRTLIRNDRRRHAAMGRQRMHSVDAREETEHLVSELCKSLHVTRLADAEAAVDSLRQVAEKTAAKHNHFVQQVLALVNSGKHHVSLQTDALIEPEAEDKALSALRALSQKGAGQGASADQQLRAKLGQALGCGYARADDAPTDEVLVARAQELCQAACKPQGILGHFMKLFDVQSIEGCLPAMNQIYSRLGELTTLHKVVRERFGMYSKSRTPSVADTIQTIERTGPRARVTAPASPVRGNLTRLHSEFHDWSD